MLNGADKSLSLQLRLKGNNFMKRFSVTAYVMMMVMLMGCSVEKDFVTLSGLNTADFQTTIDSVENSLHVITNQNGMEACIINYGARLVSLMAPDRDGNLGDVVCGFSDINGYTENSQNFGATVGRYIGRILGGKYVLDGDTVSLQTGSNGHCAHGGNPNFGARMWETVSQTGNSVTLRYVSPDGENGFPGNLTVDVTYTLTDEDALKIDYEAETDKPTVLNLTNHSFFNVSGNPTTSVESQTMFVRADSITAYDDNKCVTGEYLSVTNSPFDFRTPKKIGESIDADDPQLKATKGYDHCWTTGFSDIQGEPAAWIYDEVSGRKMEVYTTEPGIHIYTANGLKGNLLGKDSILYEKRTSVCFETCHFQNSPNYEHFPSTVLRPGEKYVSSTVYKFSKCSEAPDRGVGSAIP